MISLRGLSFKYILMLQIRNSTLRTSLFAWETLLVPDYGHLRNLTITVKPGRLGSISPIHNPTVKPTLAEIAYDRSHRMMTLFAQRSTRRLFRWRTVKSLLCSWIIVHRRPTTLTRRFYKNGHERRTYVFGFCAQRTCWDIWCRLHDRIHQWRDGWVNICISFTNII